MRIEELLNYFSYDYPAPEGEDPLSLVVDAGPCPWEPSHRLVRIGLRAREIPAAEIPPSNFIYLIDVSGSMTGRLPLVQASMKMLTDNLRPGDRVSVVTYADGVRVVSENVPGSERRRIKDVIDGLTASGSTAGGAGLECAYEVAGRCFIPGGNNRIVLCSDGDFNVGPSSDDEMGALIERQRKQSGVRLSVLGYGMGNYKDRKMQLMAERGDGNYAYVDDMGARRRRWAFPRVRRDGVGRGARRQDAGGVQSGAGRLLPVVGYDKPPAGERGFRRRPQGCGRDRCRALRHGALRADSRRRRGASGRHGWTPCAIRDDGACPW